MDTLDILPYYLIVCMVIDYLVGMAEVFLCKGAIYGRKKNKDPAWETRRGP